MSEVRRSAAPRPGARFLMTAASLVIVIAGLKVGQPVIIPFLLAVFLAVISAPAMFWLQRRGLGQVAAVAVVIAVALFAFSGVGALVGSSVNDFSDAIPRYQIRLQTLAESGQVWLAGYDIEISTEDVLTQIDPGSAMRLVSGALKGVVSALSNTLLVILTMVFILFEAAGVPAKVRAAMGDPNADLSKYAKVTAEVNRYLVIKTLVSVGTGVTVGLWVWALGVDFPFLWAVATFLLNFIPNLGSIIAAVPPVVLALVQFGPGRALAVGIGFVVVNMVFGNVVEPRYMGRDLGLSSLVVFLSLVFWGWLWGPMGMLLSVPLTMIVKIMLENSEDFRGVAVFLGPAIHKERKADNKGIKP